MGYYTKNGGLIGTGEISNVTGVSDIVTSQLYSRAGILDGLIALAQTLASSSVPTPSNLYSTQSIIESANPVFNVFALVGYLNYAEGLTGTGVSGGKRTFTSKGFNYNTTSNNILSTGNNIVTMSGGASNSLSAIDDKAWMAMAQYDGTNFDGILVWVFLGESINSSGSIIGSRTVTNVRDIFYPSGTNNNFHHYYPLAISPNGSIVSRVGSGSDGFNFSNNQQSTSSTGYYQTSRFSADDGQWGLMIDTGTSTFRSIDGNGAGTIFTSYGYGMGNQNSGDANNLSVWDGTSIGNNDNLGFVFSGDA